MKISINCGHTLTGEGCGAVGYINESDENRIIGNKVIKILKEMGHDVYSSTVDYSSSASNNLNRIVEIANSQNVDLFVSIHFNSFGVASANGTEVYTYKGNQHEEAIRIVKNISDIGFTLRSPITNGVKDGSDLYVVKNTNAKAILIEICFVSNLKDTELYKKNKDNIAIAIAEGITGQKYKMSSNNTSIPEFEEARKLMMDLGVTDGSNPKRNITREEVWTMLKRLYEKMN